MAAPSLVNLFQSSPDLVVGRYAAGAVRPRYEDAGCFNPSPDLVVGRYCS